MRYDVCSDAQLADFANIGGVSYALRLLPPGDGTGGLIVANTYDIKRLDGTGAVIQTYDAAGENCWFSMNLDPNGTSFWAGDYCSSNFYKFNIATGAIELGPINTGTGSYTLWGICIFGEPVAGAPPVGVPICNVFLTPDKLNVKRDPEHSFKVHVYPCEPMDVSVGDTAEVYVDVDDDGNFDEDYFLAIVSSTDVDGEATDIAVKVYDVSPLVAEIDPHVAIYSINNIAIVDTLGNPIDYLKLNTFSPGKFTTESALPEQVTLRQNHPNPFNPTTSIAFNLPFSTNWTLKIYNVAGQLVKGFEGFSAGWVTVNWAGTDHSGDKVSSGIYFYKLVAGDFTATKKMVLTK
ncbi:MAG: T9SS type A sorting domain-containing protein [Candidatus Zixiibacteriota bacterium]